MYAMQLGAATKRLMEAYPRIYFACHQEHRRDPKRGDEISAHQGSILDHLDEVDGTSMSQLAQHMGVTLSTMSLNIDRLEKRSYVVRRKDPADGRRVLLFLTRDGVRMKSARSVLDPDRVRRLLAQMSPEERRDGIEGLESLALAADGARRS